MKQPETTDPARWKWPEANEYVSSTSIFDPPSYFAKTISETLPIKSGETRLLDIGCGCGIIGIYSLIKKNAQFVTFNDIQEEAILETRANVAGHIRSGKIQESQVAYHQGPFDAIPKSVLVAHSLIAFNPPQLPEDWVDKKYLNSLKKDQSLSQFRLGGPDGLEIVREFLDWYVRLDSPKPDSVILLSSFLGRNLIEKTIQQHKLTRDIVETQVPLREILVAATEKFSDAERADRALKKTATGEWIKKHLTIRLTANQS